MTHFGILCLAVAGHLNPAIALGCELKERGHQVTLFCILDAQSQVQRAGLNFWAIGQSNYPLGLSAELAATLGQLKGFAVARYTATLMQKAAAMLLQEGPQALREAGIDALLVDQMYPAGGTIAEVLDLPFVTVCFALPMNQEASIPPFTTAWKYHTSRWAKLRNQAGYTLINRVGAPTLALINQYRQQWQLPRLQHPNQAYSPLAQLSQLPAALDYPRTDLPQCFHYIGPYVGPREPVAFPFEQLTGQPLIYASMGTLQRLLGIFHKIAAACAEFDVQLVISLGRGIDPQRLSGLPGSPIVATMPPQLELLKRAALTITHGGSTILESLSYGVPLLAVANGNDQPATAARLAWSGAGEFIPLNRLNVPWLRTAIAAVLTQDSYRHHAARLQREIQEAGGVSRAAEIIEQAVTTRQPVLAPYRVPTAA